MIEEYIWEGAPPKWVPIMGATAVAEPPVVVVPPSGGDAARNALRDLDYGVVVGGVNAGLIPSAGDGSCLPVWTGSHTFSANNASQQLISGYRFLQPVVYAGKRTKFKSCKFFPRPNGGAIFTAYHDKVDDLVIEDCEMSLDVRAGDTKTGLGFYGHDVILRRVWIHDVEDRLRPHRIVPAGVTPNLDFLGGSGGT